MKPAEYLKVTITNKNVIFNTQLFLGLTDSEFQYIQAAWIYSTSTGNEFAPSSLVPILKLINPKCKHLHRETRNIIFKNLESKGYFKFSYAKTTQERWYTINHGFEHLLDVIDIFNKIDLNKFKDVAGEFGGSYYKTDTYKQTKKDINKFLRILKKQTKKLKHARRNKSHNS